VGDRRRLSPDIASSTELPQPQVDSPRLDHLDAPSWLSPADLRIGLGCLRLPAGTGELGGADAHATIAAAVAAGVTVFDTARAYPGNEALLARALRGCGTQARARIVTKGGMARPEGAWVPDGRAHAIRRDCEASLAALGGLSIDLYLLHAPDPRTSWETSVRALGKLVDAGLVRRIGLSNITRSQLDRAVELAAITVVQVGLSVADDTALRSGLVERCEQLGITVIAHSPLGGPGRARRILTGDETLADVAGRHGAGTAEVALAWLLDLSPRIVAIPGARRPDAVRTAVAATRLDLDPHDRSVLAARFGGRKAPREALAPGRSRAGAAFRGEVVVLMGIPGAGKTRAVTRFVELGYHRLNRDQQGGSLRDLAAALDGHLHADGAGTGPGVVLDNTYLSRASRSHVLDVAARHGVPVRCVWLDTPLEQAQVNLVLRLLDRFGHLPSPEQLAEQARREAGLLTPTSHLRTHRQLEPPTDDEGFSTIERVTFARDVDVDASARPVVLVAASVLETPSWQRAVALAAPTAPHLIFD